MFKRFEELKAWLSSDQGASMVEYALLVVMIAIVALIAVTVGGNELSESYSEIASAVTQ